jgi:hypothetical protein
MVDHRDRARDIARRDGFSPSRDGGAAMVFVAAACVVVMLVVGAMWLAATWGERSVVPPAITEGGDAANGIRPSDPAIEVDAPESLAESGAPDGAVRVAHDPGAMSDARKGCPPPPECIPLVSDARKAGIVGKQGIQLPDQRAWKDFELLWQETSSIVLKAERVRGDVGSRIAKQSFKRGECVTIAVDPASIRPDGSFDVSEITGKRHEDEWVSTRLSSPKDGPTAVQQVRIMPGMNQEFDDATLKMRLARDMRRDAVLDFLARHK